MKIKHLRIAVPLAVMVAITCGLLLNSGTGTLSAFGWRDISLICPLGALTSMLASRTLVPRAIVALVVVAVVVVVTGRAFCSWICPAPLVSLLRKAFTRRPRPLSELKDLQAKASREDGHDGGKKASHAEREEQAGTDKQDARPLTEEELEMLRGGTAQGCKACSERFSRVDSRHLVLGGAVLSAAVFGFPVFCLICPIGLTFGTIMLLIALFGYGNVTWSVVVVPALLLVELVFFRKWCSKICPMGAMLSLVAKANATFRPQIDKSTCLETRGAHCGACTKACEQGINLRVDDLGASVSECTRCMACMEACPSKSVRLRALAGIGRKRVKEHK